MDFNEKLYGVFGYTTTVLIQKQDPEVLGKNVKETVARNKKLELLDSNKEKLGYGSSRC